MRARVLGVSFWRDNRHWVLLVLAYWVFAIGFTKALGYGLVGAAIFKGALWPIASAAVLAVAVPVLFALRKPVESPLQHVRAIIRAWRLDERLLAGLSVAVLLQVFMVCFISVKLGIPQVVPFYLDPWLVRADEALHGGPAWRVVEPIFQAPYLGALMDRIYGAWFLVFSVSVAAVAVWLERPKLRAQFLLAFFLTWVLLGTVLALGLSSVGPCFYGQFYPGADPFADKMALLRATDAAAGIPALELQANLYRTVSTGDRSFPFGISAMPSVHVAVAALLAIMACKVNRWLGVAGVLFLLTILVGSVYLAWHYALDGYVSIVGVALTWKLSGWIVNRAEAPSTAPAGVLIPAE